MPADSLSGLRVFLVEDETLVAALLEDQLEALGCVAAGTAHGLDEAMDKARVIDADVALLDLSLGGQSSTPVASLLESRDIPFVLATGYGAGDVPSGLRDRPVLHKPFRQEQLASALMEASER